MNLFLFCTLFLIHILAILVNIKIKSNKKLSGNDIEKTAKTYKHCLHLNADLKRPSQTQAIKAVLLKNLF
jgi:hypothetical protein